MENKVTAINLFKGREKSFTEKFINWALTIGRVVVIVTEGIALLAFLYRFSLDRQLIDLHEKIKQKETIVKLLKNNEDRYRNLQERLLLISNLGKKSASTSKTFIDINNLVPPDVILNNFSFSTDSLKIDLSTQSVASLLTLINSLKSYPLVNTVSLDRIENRTSNGTILVGITTTFKPQLK